MGEASRPLAAPFWAGSAPRTPTKSDADADADADYISRGAGRSPSSLSPIPEEPQERRRLSPTYEAGTPPPEGLDGPDARKALDNAIREGASIAVPSPEPDAEVSRLTAWPASQSANWQASQQYRRAPHPSHTGYGGSSELPTRPQTSHRRRLCFRIFAHANL